MAWSLPSGKKSLLLMVVAAYLILLQHSSSATDGANVVPAMSSVALPGCQEQCGDVSIPYPFGIGRDRCFRPAENDIFSVRCREGRAYLKNVRVRKFDIVNGEIRIQNTIARNCSNGTGARDDGRKKDGGGGGGCLQLPSYFYMVSNTKNKFTVIGCDTTARIVVGTNQQGSIPKNLRNYTIAFLTDGTNRSVDKDDYFSPCNYAFVVEEQRFAFKSSYAQADNLTKERGTTVPIIIDWVAGKETCEKAKTMKSYACIAKNSACVPVPKLPGYRCNCSPGYDGNPYLEGGCQDINECDSPSQYPCNGTCTNTNGSYTCIPNPAPKGAPAPVKAVIGICISIIFLILCVSTLLIEIQKKKLAKEKQRFFDQNGGQILYQRILSKQVDTVTIFTEEDLKKATDNFDRSRELGTGGHGTVYKGILKDDDNRVVAVKRSKIINVTQTDEFVQEIIILSQINHRNVVRLIGCCLEVQVPILVYEFVSNGTLFHLIHGGRSPPVSLNLRLRIAQESAEALAYLHLSTNRPIVHGDVKSLNILLDDTFTAKVTDFGASRWLPTDAVQLMTMVHGTLGYLDPEYLQERKLTEKSDVYSFGVVLLELITGKTAIYRHRDSQEEEEGKSLASSFLKAMKEKRVEGILDAAVIGVGGMEMEALLQDVAELATTCLSARGDERPSMAQVADRLRAARCRWRDLLVSSEHDVTEVFVDGSEATTSSVNVLDSGHAVPECRPETLTS